MEILGWLATLAFAGCYWPQLVKTWRRRLVGDISVWPWIIQAFGYAVGLPYGIYLNQVPLMVGYAHGLICSLLFLGMYWRYKDNVQTKRRAR